MVFLNRKNPQSLHLIGRVKASAASNEASAKRRHQGPAQRAIGRSSALMSH